MTEMGQRSLTVEWLPFSALKFDPRNPRQHSPQHVKQIERSVRSFGFNVPALVGKDNTIVAGVGRVLAGRAMGMREFPVIRLDHLTEAQAQAFRIADNRLTEIGRWDERLLAETLN